MSSTVSESQPLRVRSPTLSPPLTPPQLPHDPYNCHSVEGRLAIHRRNNPRLPTKVDQWLQANQSQWHRTDMRQVTSHVYGEEVICEVTMNYSPAVYPSDPSDPFLDTDEYVYLSLQVTICNDPHIKPHLQHSPTVVLERWTGQRDSHLAPDWCFTMEPGDKITFHQPRCIVPELFGLLASSPANIEKGYSRAILRWAAAVSTIRTARTMLAKIPQTEDGTVRRSKRRNCHS
ncbi:hypothetical protein FOMPIDRAFT_88876 [Fomitopsis schrenkii]|uniref:Uncharacterized protein n=1 Tax=Fomitopsis schrenkii TaxID=2126942 RepID=S8DIK7_FOMSC|nr:hypothetical protein FOMPIDRAFT_88876 [Fomitopsis schrenkii]